MDSKKSILRSARHFFSGTLFSRFSGALRDIVMAFTFGTKETVAAFFVAFRLAHLLRRLFGEGALQTAFVPKFEAVRKKSPERAALFFTSLYAVLFLFLISVLILGYFLLNACLNLFDSENREVIRLIIFMLPSLLFICLWGLNCGLLQCEKKYFLPSSSPAAFNSIWISGAFLIRFFQTTSPMNWLAITIVLASIAQWLITVPQTIRILKNWGLPKPKLFNQDILHLAKPLILGILGVAAVQINSALDPLFAKISDSRGPAYLWYAIRIQQVPLALFGIALSSALLPPLARAIENGEKDKYQSFLKFGFIRSLLVMTPCTLGLILFGEWGISLVYGHGQFTEESIHGTTLCLNGYALGLIPMALVLLYSPAFYAKGNYFIPSAASAISVFVNIVCNAFFVLFLGYGPQSVAVATSISAWANFVIIAFFFHTSESLKTHSRVNPATLDIRQH